MRKKLFVLMLVVLYVVGATSVPAYAAPKMGGGATWCIQIIQVPTRGARTETCYRYYCGKCDKHGVNWISDTLATAEYNVHSWFH